MKILHLNTHSYGGAAVVARRLHAAALASGMDSHFITKHGLRSDPTPRYSALQDARLRYLLRAQVEHPALYRIGRFVQRWAEHKNLANRPSGFEIFSPLNTRQQFSECTTPLDPDIVHLHWVNDFVDHEEFFRRNSARKFVWTLHDMNPFTGGCHHADGCTRFTSGCAACPQLSGTVDASYASQVLQAKERSLAHLGDDQLIVTAPSDWLLSLSAQSPLTARFRHVRIDNPAALVTEDSKPRSELRASLGLPQDRKVVLFASDNLRKTRKGFDVLFAAARLLPNKEQVHFVGVGQRGDAPAGFSSSFPGHISDEETLMRYYACADLVVLPSVAENAPLVVIEALSCGTPVVAFDVGGIPELIDEDSGVLAETYNAESLAAAISKALWQSSFERTRIRARAARFAPARVLAQYKKIYEELLVPATC